MRLRLTPAEDVQHRGEAFGWHARCQALKDGLRQPRTDAAQMLSRLMVFTPVTAMRL